MFERRYIFQTIIFGIYVRFRGVYVIEYPPEVEQENETPPEKVTESFPIGMPPEPFFGSSGLTMFFSRYVESRRLDDPAILQQLIPQAMLVFRFQWDFKMGGF